MTSTIHAEKCSTSTPLAIFHNTGFEMTTTDAIEATKPTTLALSCQFCGTTADRL
jgi:hypothetical protein